MIEMITGAPGAGKTTYAVAERMLAESLRVIVTEDGGKITRRLVCAGFRGLVIEHQRLPHKLTGENTSASEVDKWNEMADDGRSDAPKHQRLAGEPPKDVPAIVQNWWLWCQPGDLICIDEAQFVAPRGTMGKKPPYWIQALEIHRHYGVDFLLVTQHPQLIDTTIRALVGLHRHVRSVMGSPLCMVYLWDHASNPERFQMANKESFLRRPKHYKLFHSSVAHLKPPSAGRGIVIVLPIMALVVAGLFWKFSERFRDTTSQAVAAVSPAKGASSPLASASLPHTGKRLTWREAEKLGGCWAVRDDCRCITPEGLPVIVPQAMCKVSASTYDGLVKWEPRKLPEEKPAPSVPAASGVVPQLL